MWAFYDASMFPLATSLDKILSTIKYQRDNNEYYRKQNKIEMYKKEHAEKNNTKKEI